MDDTVQVTRESAHPLVIQASTLVGFESSQIQAILDRINPPPIVVEPVSRGDDDTFTNPNIQ
jgi:hypothetical protein